MKRIAVAGVASLALVIVGIGACSDEAAPPLPTSPTSGDGGTTDPTEPSAGPASAPDDTSAPTGEPSTTISTTSTSTTTVPPTTTTTLPPLVTKGAVVLVANAADVPGAAGRFTQVLEAAGYATNPATDAAGWEIELDTSKIYYLRSSKKAAASLAERMGVEIYPMPVPVPIVGAYEFFGDTTVLVMLGKDLADQPVPGLTG